VGFDRIADMLDRASRVVPMTSWPPYNIEKTGGDQYRITMAVAGFSPDEIELTQNGNSLLVTGQKHPDPKAFRSCIAASPLARSSRPSTLLTT
jgi:molecular chaperone IbpA